MVAIDEVYHFEPIKIGQSIDFSCIYGQTDEAKRMNKTDVLSRSCLLNTSTTDAQWQPVDLSTCRRNDKKAEVLQYVNVVS